MRGNRRSRRLIARWAAAVTIAAALTPAVIAQQPQTNMPSADEIAAADSFDPPKLIEESTKLANQPDLTGMWSFIQPEGACRGPLFDPPNSICPYRPVEGEATFGPLPGTKVTSIPYNEEYQAIYDLHVAESLEGKARDTFATCVPYGVPRMVGEAPTPFDIIQGPDIILWYNNYTRTQRRIFLDFEPEAAPQQQDGTQTQTFAAGPTYSGFSVGHWEGNTLVVHTTNMINAYFDETASPHSDKLEMTERIRLISEDVIENEMTLVDPEAFTKPWVVKRYYRRVPSRPGELGYLRLNDTPCIPNVRLDENGYQVMLLPQEIEAEEARARGLAPPAQ